MRLLSQEQLNNIRTSVDIVDVISKYMPLTHKGNNFWGICPFHQDNNPSMCVSPDKQIFTCFVCHKTGNVFNFIMDYEHISFMEAIHKVADMANIKLDINFKTQHNDIDNDLYNIYKDTTKIYQNNINNALGSEARTYLKNRDINEDVIAHFQIGLSLKKQDVLVKSLTKKYQMKDLIKSGLIVKNDYGYNDIYADRIMFPLWDLNGNVVGFSGRIYNTLEGSKYINSKETEIFKKGELLYNYHNAKDICRNLDTVIIMEGFMDVIAAYKVDINNVVAMMGTAVTKYQANLIKRMANNIILLFDGDEAGAKATMRSIDGFVSMGVMPKVVRLPDNLDPDEYIKKYGKESFVDILNNPINIMDFKLSYLKQGKDLTSDIDKANYVNKLLKELENINDEVLIELTLKKISIESGLDIEFLRNKITKKEESKPIPIINKEINLNKYEKAEQSLLYYMLRTNEAIKVYNNLDTYMPTERYRILSRNVSSYYKEHGLFDIAGFLDVIADKENMMATIGEVNSLSLKDDVTLNDLNDYATVIEEYGIKIAIREYENQMKKTTSTKEKAMLGEEIRKLKVRRDKKCLMK